MNGKNNQFWAENQISSVVEAKKKSGKEQHKSVNDHEQQTNLLRADCKFVDMH